MDGQLASMSQEDIEDQLVLEMTLKDSLDPDSADYYQNLAERDEMIENLHIELERRRGPDTALKRLRSPDPDDSDASRASKLRRRSPTESGDSPASQLDDDSLPSILSPHRKPAHPRFFSERMRQEETRLATMKQQNVENSRISSQLSQNTFPSGSSFASPSGSQTARPNLVQRSLNGDGTLPRLPPRRNPVQSPPSFQSVPNRPRNQALDAVPLAPFTPLQPAYMRTTNLPTRPNHASLHSAAPTAPSPYTEPPLHIKQENIAPSRHANGHNLGYSSVSSGTNIKQEPSYLQENIGQRLPWSNSTLSGGHPSSVSSDDSLAEIDPSDFKPSTRTLVEQAAKPVQQQPYHDWRSPNSGLQRFGDRPTPHLSSGTQNDPYDLTGDAPASSRHIPWNPRGPAVPSQFNAPSAIPFSQNRQLSAAGPSSAPAGLLGQVGAAASGILGGIKNSLLGLGTPSMPSYDPFAYLYSDPTRSAEEIKALLDNVRPDEDLPPELRKGTPEAMQTTLMEHQKLGLTWLQKQETGTNKGGILADDMGLGKTIQAIALMVSRASEDPRRKTNLIIAPVALLRQWEAEIKEKVKARHRLTTFRYHGNGKKPPFSKLREYDVVLTTYGSLTSELKKKDKIDLLTKQDPGVRLDPKKHQLSLIGRECKWYRVILDEAQNIKNRNALCSRAVMNLDATYRLCMTGTPMMNSVDELYPLIRFCRIKPYCEWTKFNVEIARSIKNGDTSRGYRKLQALIRAIMLRRTKTSTLDGKPLITLPERTLEQSDVTFEEDDESFYRELEQKAQARVKNMIKNRTLGKHYSNALVLLLRLRQACDHQMLVTFSESAATMAAIDADPSSMLDLAKELADDVVGRIKEAAGAFTCPICLDATENPAIMLPCGHPVCSECFTNLRDNNALVAESSGPTLKCPICRTDIQPTRITDFMSFKRVHQPDLLDSQENRALDDALGPRVESSESESDSDSDGSETSSLDGFIVDDDDSSDSEEKPKKGKGKAKKKGPSKTKSSEKLSTKHMSLAQLRQQANSNRKAHKKYWKKLERLYHPSAKINRTIELMREIQTQNPGEKVLIFSQFTSFLDLLQIGLQRDNWKTARYDGAMSSDHRAAAVERFKREADIRVMLISLKAGNAGLNLNFASQVIIMDPFWNPYIEEQAIDRAHRIGQQRNVHVHRVVVPGTVEDRILALQEKKRETINRALDESEGKSIARLGQTELAYLFGLDMRGHQIANRNGRPALPPSTTTPAPTAVAAPRALASSASQATPVLARSYTPVMTMPGPSTPAQMSYGYPSISSNMPMGGMDNSFYGTSGYGPGSQHFANANRAAANFLYGDDSFSSEYDDESSRATSTTMF